MLNMDPITLRTAQAQLQQATQDHAEWHENLLRNIVCGQPFNLDDLGPGSHAHCQFCRWYFERAPCELWGEPAFAEIGPEHDRLHRIAARLLREVAAIAPIVREDFEDLLAACAQLRVKLESLRHAIDSGLQNRDVLTGAYDRAAMLSELRNWHELAKRNVQPCCIVFMDLDQFKEINDTHGHVVGDAVLASAVRHLGHRLRPYDKVFRYGGDEFLICLPGADLEIGQAVIKRVRERLASQPLVNGPAGTALQVTASFGLAMLDPEVTIEDSIERADQALMLAKTAGRNRAINWDPNVTTGTRLPRLRMEDVKG